MAKDHGPSVKNDKQYEGLQKGHEQGTRREDRQQPRILQARRQEFGLGHQAKRHVPGRHQGTEGRRRTQGGQNEQLVTYARKCDRPTP